MPAIKMRHLAKLTDKFGIFQFAILDEPDSEWGYTLDDNARALVVTSWYYDLTKNATAKKLAEVYLNFIKKAVDPKGGFKNYFKTKHLNQTEINNEQGLEDSAARAPRLCVTSPVDGMRRQRKPFFPQNDCSQIQLRKVY